MTEERCGVHRRRAMLRGISARAGGSVVGDCSYLCGGWARSAQEGLQRRPPSDR